jgi:hypothetical protein
MAVAKQLWSLGGRSFVDEWMRVVCSGSPSRAARLYALDAVLVPTVGPEVLVGRDLIRGYFEQFMGDRPELCGEVEQLIEQKGRGVQVLNGTYRFQWLGPSGPEQVRARYTYVLTPGERSPIVTHHSSAVPEPSA